MTPPLSLLAFRFQDPNIGCEITDQSFQKWLQRRYRSLHGCPALELSGHSVEMPKLADGFFELIIEA